MVIKRNSVVSVYRMYFDITFPLNNLVERERDIASNMCAIICSNFYKGISIDTACKSVCSNEVLDAIGKKLKINKAMYNKYLVHLQNKGILVLDRLELTFNKKIFKLIKGKKLTVIFDITL